MQLVLKTLTPVHIGDGTQLHSFDYVVHGGRYYRISQTQFERFLLNLDADKPDSPSAEQFASWAMEMADQIENVDRDRRNAGRQGGRDYNQELSRLRSAYNLMAFCKSIGKDAAFITFLKNEVRGLPLLMEGARPKQEIRGFIRSADGTPYIPGSTIKGSIRTALLYHYLNEFADYQKVAEELRKQVDKISAEKVDAERKRLRFNLDRHRKTVGETIEQAAFFAGMVTERGQRRNGEAQNDLMRCLLVSDVSLPDDALAVDNIDLYLVKKLPKGQGNHAQRQSQSPAVEVLQSGLKINVRIDINLELLLKLHYSGAGDEGLLVKNEKHFIGWREKAKWLFNLDKADFDNILPGTPPSDPRCQALRDKALKHVLACVQAFTDAQEQAYQRWQRNYCLPAHNGNNDARAVEAGMDAIAVEGLRFHLGFATGFEGMTEALHLIARHKQLFADIMELFGIGDSPTAWKNRKPGETYRANPDQFPKSRRLATRPGLALPLGWLGSADAVQKASGIAAAGSVPSAPVTPTYLRGTLKMGAELNGELLQAGNPGRFKLFIRLDYEPEVEVKYPAGFKPEDIGRIALIRVKNLKGKEEIVSCEFIRFRTY